MWGVIPVDLLTSTIIFVVLKIFFFIYKFLLYFYSKNFFKSEGFKEPMHRVMNPINS